MRTAHQRILLDGSISANQFFSSTFLSKITKYKRPQREFNHGPANCQSMILPTNEDSKLITY